MALAFARVMAEQVFGDDQSEHPVAQELQALVIALVLLGGAVGERLGEQRFGGETVAEPLRNLLTSRRGERGQGLLRSV